MSNPKTNAERAANILLNNSSTRNGNLPLDANEKQVALNTLKKSPEAGLRLLVNALGDVNVCDVNAAVDAIGEVGGTKEIPVLMHLLKQGEFESTILQAIGKIAKRHPESWRGKERIVKELAYFLGKCDELEEEHEISWAIDVLGELRHPKAIPALLKVFADNFVDMNDEIVDALRKIAAADSEGAKSAAAGALRIRKSRIASMLSDSCGCMSRLIAMEAAESLKKISERGLPKPRKRKHPRNRRVSRCTGKN